MAVEQVTTISSLLRFQPSFMVTKPKIKVNKKGQDRNWFVNSFNEFCNATALHGYGYIVRKEASLVER